MGEKYKVLVWVNEEEKDKYKLYGEFLEGQFRRFCTAYYGSNILIAIFFIIKFRIKKYGVRFDLN